MNRREKRIFDTELRVEKREDGTVEAIVGHAAVYNKLSEDLGGFRERIDPGFFDNVLDDDVRALVDHNSSMILGRTKSGTLTLANDKKGLGYRIEPVGSRSYEEDLIESLERGDVDQSSFGFRVEEDKWEEDKKGNITRTLLKARRLYDVSPVTFPAYPQTDVAKRSLDKWKTETNGTNTTGANTHTIITTGVATTVSTSEDEAPTEVEIKENLEIKKKKLALMELEVKM